MESDDPSVLQDIESNSEDDTVLNISQLKDIRPVNGGLLNKGSSLSTQTTPKIRDEISSNISSRRADKLKKKDIYKQ